MGVGEGWKLVVSDLFALRCLKGSYIDYSFWEVMVGHGRDVMDFADNYEMDELTSDRTSHIHWIYLQIIVYIYIYIYISLVKASHPAIYR